MNPTAILRNLASVSMATALAVAVAHSAAGADPKPGIDAHVSMAPIAAYRAYAKTQADSLVGMTKVLAREIADGNLEAAQSAYAPAHRYLARIAPLVQMTGDFAPRMDARADVFAGRERDPAFAGFHRIEYGLFAERSTGHLSEVADRLLADARALRERIARLDLTPDALLGRAALLVEDDAIRALAGSSERYAKTDLWDLEAHIDGVREIVALAQSQQGTAQSGGGLDRATQHFIALDALLAAQKEGCGFKSYDTLKADEKMAFKPPLLALAATLSLARGSAEVD